jgi:hypothetical protein
MPQHPVTALREVAAHKTLRHYLFYFLFLSILFLCLNHLLKYGTLENLIFSTIPRGAGQFEELDLLEMLARFSTTVSNGVGAIAAIIVGVLVGRKTYPSFFDFIIVVALLVLCSAALFSSFSRGSGLPMFLAAISIFIPRKARFRHLAIALMLVCIGVYLSVIGITQRSGPQGVGSFVLSALNPDLDMVATFIGVNAGVTMNYPNVNFFDAIAPMSAHIHFSDTSDRNVIGSIKDLFFSLQPLPATLFSQPVRFGASLSGSLGTVGSVGLTTPALAELYFLFGWPFVVLAAAYGWLLRRADVALSEGQRMTRYIIFLLIIGGVIIAGHSGLRAFARPTVLAIMLMFLSNRTYVLGRFRLAI